ncbi:prepilin-type N-terminal cleavage/methylation domain-containing protein [Candidatus Methylocalor cossyra]|uniref:General secretion pathway protein J n=1 Tax=Candidatus Methylocalor cossyra TaxID=3108543 RepID=A0ABM9NKN3_9GAMM
MNRLRAAPGQGGFTLLEVLIATTLMAIMMVLLTGSLRIGAASWDAGEERMARASRLAIVENFLRTHLGSLLPVTQVTREGRVEGSFRGGSEFLEYVAPLPEQVKAGGLFRFRLYLSEAGERKDLRVSILPYVTQPVGEDSLDPVDDLALVEGVRQLRFAYLPRVFQTTGQPFGAGPFQSVRQPLEWLESWQDTQLPALIRLDIEPDDEDPWPTLVVAPRTQSLR